MISKTASTPRWKIFLFGAPEIQAADDVRVKLPAKTKALLFYLAVTRRSHLRASLASLLWGEMPEKNARANLRKAILQLRAIVPNQLIIEQQAVGVRESAEIWVDVVEFEERLNDAELGKAIELYRGDFLTGFFVRNAPEFESWQLSQQARLRESMISSLQLLINRLVADNEVERAVAAAKHIIRLEPWREETHRQLMQLLAQSGQRTAALNQYELCRQTLWDEMAVEPSVATQAVYEQLKKQSKTDSANGVPQFVTTTDYRLVGREDEWKVLQTQWRQLAQPHCVCIAGDAGIGKTRLAEELLMLAEREGQQVARARSHALEGRLAYAPVADWLRSDPLKSGLPNLDDVWLTEIARLLPELLSEHPALRHPEPIREGWQRKRLFEALAIAVMQNKRRLLLVLDDLQWCDTETLEWLQYLLESTDAPLLVVGTVRPEELEGDHPLHRIRHRLRRLDRCTDLALDALTPDATMALAKEVAEEDLNHAVAQGGFSNTAGNPLFVIESVRAASAETMPHRLVSADLPQVNGDINSMPPKMYSVIQSRLTRLSSEEIRIAQVAATIGREFDVPFLVLAAEATTESVLVSLDRLWQQRIIREVDGTHFDFTHDRIRDVAYAEIRPIQKQLLHKKIVHALEALHETNHDEVAGELAEHCHQAKMLKQALYYYRQAANVAKQLFAYNDVAHYLEAALAIAETNQKDPAMIITAVDLLHQLGKARILTHDWGSDPVASAWDREYELATKIEEPFYRCRALLDISTYRRNRGEWYKARELLSESLRVLPNMKGSLLVSQLLTGYGGVLYHMEEPVEALAYFDKAFDAEKGKLVDESYEWVNLGNRSENVVTLVRSAKALGLIGYLDQARQRSAEALQLEKGRSIVEHYSGSWDFSAMLYTFVRDMQMVRELGSHLVAMSTQREFPFYVRAGHMFVAWAEAHLGGDARACAQIVRESVDGHRDRGIRMFEPYWRGLLAETLALAGEYEEASKECHEALAFAAECGNGYWNAQLLKQMGDYQEVLLTSGETAESYYLRAIDTARRQQAKLLELRATTSLCRSWQKQGKSGEARQLLTDIYGWFTEGFDSVDLQEAKKLIDELDLKMAQSNS